MSKNLLISVVGIMLISSCLCLRDFKQVLSFLMKTEESRQSKKFSEGLFESMQSPAFLKKLQSVPQNNLRFHSHLTQPNKEGHATNCGPPDHKFSLTWEPEIIDPSGTVTFKIDMKSPMDFGGGTVEIGVSLKPGEPPVISNEIDFDCNTVKKYFRTQKCPVKKGEHISVKYFIPDMSIYSIPSDDYALKVTVKDTSQNVYLCADLVITIG